MKRQMVKGLMAQGETLKVALEAVDLASSSYYYRPAGKRKPRVLDAALVAAITEVRRGHNEVYGYRKVTRALRAGGLAVNAKKVLRHLRVLGFTQPRKLKGRKWSRPVIVRPTVNNVYWEADFTYVWTGKSNAYLCAVIDACARDIAGDALWKPRKRWKEPSSAVSGEGCRMATR